MRITRKELQEYIKAVIQEYTGTGDMASTGLTSDDGINITSQRSRWDDEEDEMEFYNDTGAPYGGAEDQHTSGMETNKGSFNQVPFTKF